MSRSAPVEIGEADDKETPVELAGSNSQSYDTFDPQDYVSAKEAEGAKIFQSQSGN